jgi:DNA-binding response OmpR family regulator
MSHIKIKVLLIEEDEDVASDIQAMLNGSEHPRFQVTRARDLVAGMELLTEEEYHAVILDPAACGDLAAKAVTTIRTVAAEPAIILLASPDQESNTTRGIVAGAVEYFVLDEFDSAVFKLRLRRTIAKHWIQRQFEPARYAGAAIPPVAGID